MAGDEPIWGPAHSVEAPLSAGQDRGVAQAMPEERYERRGVVGRGGMGEVDVVRDRWLGRDVARKVVRGEGRDDRLAHEAAITARLDHPSIITVLDMGVDDEGRRFYTMQLVRGASMARSLRDADLPERLALVRPLLAAAQAIHYAHRAGVVHRDLKPDNIIVGRFGEVQVIDWGIAEPAGSPGRPEGTAPYADPGQLAGDRVCVAHDVHALGRCLEHLLRGGVPDGDVPDEVPADLAAVVQRATAPLPQRYPSAGDLAADLEAWLEGRPVAAHAYTPREHLARALRAYRQPLSIAAVAACVLVVVGAWAFVATRAERDRAVAAEEQARGRLASLLIDKAVDAFEEGRIPEAERAATQGLALRPDPRAVGVLAAAHPPPPTATFRGPAPCERPRLLGDGRLACLDEDGVGLWAGAPPRLERRLRARAPIEVVAAGPHLVTAAPSPDGGTDLELTLHRDDGQTRPLGRTPLGRLSDGGPAVLVHHVEGVRVPVDGAPTVPWSPCPGTQAPVATPSWSEGRAAWACEGLLAWETADGPIHSEPVREGVAALALAGDEVVATFHDGTVAAFDPPGPRWRTRILGGTSPRLAVDEARLVVTPESGGVVVLDRRTGHALATLPSAEAPQVALQGDALIQVDPSLTVWTLPPPARPHQLQVPGGVTSVAFSETGDLAIGAGSSLVTARADGELQVRPQGPDCSPIKDVAWLGDRIVRGCATLTRSVGLVGPTGTVQEPSRALAAPRVVLAGDGILAATYGRTQWRLDPDDLSLTRQALPARWIDLEARSGRVWGLSEDGRVREVRPEGVDETGLSAGEARVLAVGPDGASLALAGGHAVWRIGADGARVWRVEVPSRVTDLAWSPRGEVLAVGTLGGRTWALDPADGRVLAILPGHEQRVSAVGFSQDGRLLATGSWDRTVRLWDTARLRPGSPP